MFVCMLINDNAGSHTEFFAVGGCLWNSKYPSGEGLAGIPPPDCFLQNNWPEIKSGGAQ